LISLGFRTTSSDIIVLSLIFILLPVGH
jgi:hypothetical protein